MNDLSLLQELFGEKLIKSEIGDYGKSCIKLEEDKSEYSVTIQHTPEDIVAIKADSFPDLREFFNCSSHTGQCKRADFVIIANKKLIFIELSSSKKINKEVIQQLKGAQCVIEYCQSIGENFYDHSFFKDYQSYFVSISHIGTHKRPSRSAKINNDSLDRLLKISVQSSIPFKKLYSETFV
ncbi:hypothetical protein BTHERMOSOX_803 [Bathymodiolus thermophilus thioautotrophic gill symbiont]|uniref:Uncharacterized protein n=1 Tax=Bathymodiolus thermophilus thioautotrophic gill symbiont TaxID=2360 RepID=A0A1J5U7V5_9GAMM|nr:hypothetical protein [Bathymodiolus thermophilus thioautotrophic gill symbiont]OIR24926.1 hypothetical protein BGC33_04945 [Bathymodiolus thermophilus thioautotrophic gill symbiont]CAB5506518.1 hypothetical protein THERMOS_2344 [Bathymodiolus thermophilus thioautotrophic gill symbiont]SHA05483.1 hypothetical protein BTHERMOSOX_803 [Bathymodiolus thermophilus thioautotrophic gill symbiont]